MILVTGASGMAGGAVLAATTSLGLQPHAMFRTPAEAAAADAPAVIADYADPPSLARALHGIDRVYLVCGPIPQLVDYESAMIDACTAAGIGHIVLNSALGAGRFAKSFPSWHAAVEQKLQSSGLPYTILRPNGFMQNIFTYNAQTIRAAGEFYAAMGEAKTSLIDVRDIGAIAAGILQSPEPHDGQIYELNGPAAFSNAEVAAELTRATGSTVAFVDIPEAAQRAAMLGQGMPAWQVDAILELQEYYRSGQCAGAGDVTARLLGGPPRTLAAYLRENAAAFSRVSAAQ